MRVVFLGTPDFAVPTLEGIVRAGWEVPLVVTQPDRPKGRGQQVSVPPVKAAAAALGLPVYQPERIRRPEALEVLRAQRAEAMVVVGYGQIIPQSIIDLPPLGIFNVHGSLLPRYRGAAPVQWAVANGETRTGVTIMRIDAGLDTGDVLLARETDIDPDETAADLAGRLSVLGAGLLLEALEGLRAGKITPVPQDSSLATLAPILEKEDGRIEWTWAARVIHNRVRGFQPWPGAWTRFRGQLLSVWRTRQTGERPDGPPGSLHLSRRGLLAACGDGAALELLELQLEGRKRAGAEAFRNGHRVVENESLGDLEP